MIEDKFCPKCEAIKTVSDFRIFNRKKYGLRVYSYCIACTKIEERKTYMRHPENKKKSAAKWKADNPEKRSLYNKLWKKNNPDKLKRYYEKEYRSTRGRDRYLLKYGLTRNDYDRMLTEQNNRCRICSVGFDIYGTKRTKPHIDHKHDASKKVRGLLCNDCNLGISNLKDDPVIMRMAAAYVQRFS